MLQHTSPRQHCMTCLLVGAVVATTAVPSWAQVPTSAKPDTPETKPLIVALMGDPQIPMVPETPAHVTTAIDDLRELPFAFLAVLGDLVQNQAKYYADYRRLILNRMDRPVFSLAGNGDYGAGLDAYQKTTGLPLYYAIQRRGIRFVFLSTVRTSGRHKHICHLGNEQMAWLQRELSQEPRATTVIFSHAPVFETTWHSEDRSDQQMPGSMYLAESAALRKLFTKHANIKVFAHGHLHYRYGTHDKHGRGGYFLENGVLHVSVGATANGMGSSVLYIEPKRVVVRMRNHAEKKWDDRFRYVVNVATTLAPLKE